MAKQSFAEKVYNITAQIPRGKVATYKAIAHQLSCKAYRAVGSALNKNPYAPRVPCHRVINANGELGGFASGLKKKIQMLRQEGVIIKDNKINLGKFGHKWR
ncbi:MAG TPA: MGMT family protein [Candidatus Nanoarchaeia archaeon]|nr:MGMT family protein [Candidatus Nanoarchaeia archaeon]